jgi:hypothetical protein
MARDKGDLGDILTSVVDRLRSEVPGCNEATCYLALNPDAIGNSPGDHIFVVAPMSGQFDEGMWDGGGLEQLTANGGIIVKIHCPILLDDHTKEAALLTDEKLSIIRKANKVIGVLCDPEWSPTKDNNELTRNPLSPSGYTIDRDSFGRVGGIELSFRCVFDWDTTRV